MHSGEHDLDTSRLKAVRDAIEQCYLGFAHGGLHLGRWDIEAELAEANDALDMEWEIPTRPPQSLQFKIIETATGEAIGECSRRLVHRHEQLLMLHNQLKIRRRSCRGRGFASALLGANEAWYPAEGISAIMIEATGDGSLFAASRGFELDLHRYRTRNTKYFNAIPSSQLHYAAIDELLTRGKRIFETVEGDQAAHRPNVREFLEEVVRRDESLATLVEAFHARFPAKPYPGPEGAFRSPAEIEAFERDAPIPALESMSLGRAVLRHTSWTGIKEL